MRAMSSDSRVDGLHFGADQSASGNLVQGLPEVSSQPGVTVCEVAVCGWVGSDASIDSMEQRPTAPGVDALCSMTRTRRAK
jgi:hypothetical protein